MNSKILSARLTLTKLALHDWELFRSIYTNPTLMKHIGATMSDEAQPSANDVGLISICTRNREKLTAEVGFILLEAYKGKGYATEAIKLIIDFAVDTFGFKKFTAVCSEVHVASRRVLEKAGMNLDEIVPDSTEINGQMVNDCFYSLEK